MDLISELIQNRDEINEIINVVKVFVSQTQQESKLRQNQGIQSLANVGVSIEQVDSKKKINPNENYEKMKLTNLKVLEQLLHKIKANRRRKDT